MGPFTDRRRFLGRTYIRDEVWRRYMDEYSRLGHIGNTSWIKPSPPPHENNPYVRLPTLNPAGSDRQGAEAWGWRHLTQWRLRTGTTSDLAVR